MQPIVHVIATTFDGTQAAIAAAIPLARGSGAKLVVIVPRLVSYAVDLDQPAEFAAFFVKRYENIVHELGGSAEVEVCLCRTLDDIMAKVAGEHSRVVVGGPVGRWLTSPEERFTNRLIRAGCSVVFVATGPNVTRRRVAPVAAAIVAGCALVLSARSAAAQTGASRDELLKRVAALEVQIAELKALIEQKPLEAAKAEVSEDERVYGDYLHDLKFGAVLDTYYGFNFNHPIGRVNLLRAYDVTSNNFSLSQATFAIESAPHLDAGRRFGGRVDLQYGQATETLQGSLANEPRPWVYRNIFQAFGTYVAPVGRGLTVDFGKWASALGYENNYSKDQINYSRSYWFNFLPFYHMGARAAFKTTDALTLNYWITNGTQQTEAFNNFKDQMAGLVLQPSKTLTWTANYYLGQEHPDVQAVQSPGEPTLPTQPGLSIVPVQPYFTGKLQIFDTYANWQPTVSTTFVAEADYVSSQNPAPAPASSVAGGALYARRQLTAKTALGVRGEYLADRGGLFSGTTQNLKEATVTYDYRVNEGFLVRSEWRHDWSDQPFFLTSTPKVYETSQDTATLAVTWWWGTKRGVW
jgi:Putative beta-barrel porin-2, OmpL-like. bbp2